MRSLHFFPSVSMLMVSLLAVLFSNAGCRVQAGNPQSGKPPQPGTVTVSLADAPVDDLEHLYITVQSIAFAPERAGRCLRDPRNMCADSGLLFFDLASPAEVDLLSLSDGKTQALPFQQDLPAGVYEGIRLLLSEGSLVRGVLKETGESVEIAFPAGPFGRREFTLLEEFAVQENTLNEILIHVDLRRSVRKSGAGQFMLLPFVNSVPARLAARLSGAVSSTDAVRVCAYNLMGRRRMEGIPPPAVTPAPMPTSGSLPPLPPLPPPPPPPAPSSFPSPSGVSVQLDTTESCDNAEVVSDIKDGRYDLRYLAPVLYQLRVFKTDGTYTDTSLSNPLFPKEERELDL
ncbi:MAG: hypothetical protein RIR26_217 [Pseudomonadota bacterium]